MSISDVIIETEDMPPIIVNRTVSVSPMIERSRTASPVSVEEVFMRYRMTLSYGARMEALHGEL